MWRDGLFKAVSNCGVIALWLERWCALPEALGSIPSCTAWIFPSLHASVSAFFLSTGVLEWFNRCWVCFTTGLLLKIKIKYKQTFGQIKWCTPHICRTPSPSGPLRKIMQHDTHSPEWNSNCCPGKNSKNNEVKVGKILCELHFFDYNISSYT